MKIEAELTIKRGKLRFRFMALGVDYDKDYGCEKLTGWSIVWRLHYLVILERCPAKAIYKALFSGC